MLMMLVCVLVATVMGDSIPVSRVQSKAERMLDDDTWEEYYQIKKMTQRDQDVDPIVDDYNTLYIGKMDIGTPKQTFRVVLDTASADFWVVDSTWEGRGNKTKFNSGASSTYKSLGGKFHIRYGRGNVDGITGQDVVGFTGTQYSFATQMFGQVTRIDHDFPLEREPIDGMCGLAFTAISALKTPNPWLNIVNAPGFKGANNTFTVWLQELYPTPINKIGGAFTFGEPDTTHCAATGDWVPLSQDLYFEFKVDGVGAGGKFSAANSAITDTGAGFMVGPHEDIRNIATAINATHDQGRGLYMIDCDRSKTTTTIDVKINSKVYSISPKNFIVGPFGNETHCFAAMVGANLGTPAWVLGDPFIREYCNVYDLIGKRVGLFKSTM